MVLKITLGEVRFFIYRLIVVSVLVSYLKCDEQTSILPEAQNVQKVKPQQSKFNLKSRMQCSRPHSKAVREYFARGLLPIYQKYSLPVPEKCPFSPVYDIYHFHENNKTKLDTTKWKCEICGKMFISENHLDKHFENRHTGSLQLNSNSICLASYCRIFRCDVLMNHNSNSRKCYESNMVNLKTKCKTYLDSCIPQGIPYTIKNKLTIELRENLCSYLTCSKYNELPSYMSRGPSFITIFIIVFIIGLCIIAYGVINHTDLIFDENEVIEVKNEDTCDSGAFSETSMLNQSNLDQSNKLVKQPGFRNVQNQSNNLLRHRVVQNAETNGKINNNYSSLPTK